jgi:hypothetical protein
MWQSAMVHMHGAKFGTTVQGRHCLARIEQPVRVKRGFQLVEQGQFARTELRTHLVDFLHAHPVLASDAAAYFDTQFENLAAKFLGADQLARLGGIVENQRVQIAIPGMENIDARQAVFLRQLSNPLQYPPQM